MANPLIKERRSPVAPAGEGRSAWRTALEAGAAVLQDMTPLKDFDIYVVGLHCARGEPGMQIRTAADLLAPVRRTTRCCKRSPSRRNARRAGRDRTARSRFAPLGVRA